MKGSQLDSSNANACEPQKILHSIQIYSFQFRNRSLHRNRIPTQNKLLVASPSYSIYRSILSREGKSRETWCRFFRCPCHRRISCRFYKNTRATQQHIDRWQPKCTMMQNNLIQFKRQLITTNLKHS